VKTLYRCWAEVDLDALRGNLAWLRHQVGPGARLMTVVKADAYGHGLKQIAALLMQSGTDIFGVANLTEAQVIRSVGPGWPVLMLGACLPEEIERAVRDEVRPTLSSFEEAAAFAAMANRLGREVLAHVKIDTGMGRLGIRPGQAVEELQRMRELRGLKLEGIYTHYASAEDDAAFSAEQARVFRGLLADLKKAGVEFPVIHANNSAAILHQADTRFNLVRPGLLVYGIAPAGRRRLRLMLTRHVQPALSLKCRVSLVKSVPAGSSLSYGRTLITRRRMRVATVTAGYGDGYLRAAGGRARVLIGGRRCTVLGRITMDQMLVDITRVGKVTAGDEVVLIGEQGDEAITAAEVAEWAGTIPWEVLTAITYRVPRVYRGGNAS
jgi:alanine racemase